MCVGFSTTRVTELWMPPRWPVTSLPGMFTIFSCAWYIMHHARIDPLRDDGAGDQRAVGVVGLDPVVVGDAHAFRVVLADPDHGPPRFSVSISRLSV